MVRDDSVVAERYVRINAEQTSSNNGRTNEQIVGAISPMTKDRVNPHWVGIHLVARARCSVNPGKAKSYPAGEVVKQQRSHNFHQIIQFRSTSMRIKAIMGEKSKL